MENNWPELKGLIQELLTNVDKAANHKKPYQLWPNSRIIQRLKTEKLKYELYLNSQHD